jgi:hypothetical protein
MAQDTRQTIVNNGLALAGREELTSLANVWLQRWLDAVAASWDWPMLRQELAALALPLAGSPSGGFNLLSVATVGLKVLKVFDNATISTAANETGTGLTRLPIVNNRSSAGFDRMNNETRGRPQTMRLTQPSFGTYNAYFNPWPDQQYYMNIAVKVLPAALAADGDIPWYPNDETMVQLVRFKALEYVDSGSPEMQMAQQQLAGLLSNDRVRYGQLDEVSDGGPMQLLSRSSFRHNFLKR